MNETPSNPTPAATWLVFPLLLAAVCGGSLALLRGPLPAPAVTVVVLLGGGNCGRPRDGDQ